MKRNFHCFVLLVAVAILTGCESTKYTYNQVLGDQKEFGTFQTKERPPKGQSTGIILADADNWVKDHLW